MLRRLIAPVAAAAAALAIGGAASASAATHPVAKVIHPLTSSWITAVTAITNRPDSGNGGYWADDNFTRVAKIKLIGEVAAANCPGSLTGHCYLWDGQISDRGTFTTIAGAAAPRTGTLDDAVTGRIFGGSTDIQFYASWKTAKASRVPTAENDADAVPAARHTTTNWVELFFGGAQFNSAANPGGPDLGSRAGWTYTLPFGADSACPNDAYRWVDAVASGWGTTATDGNILAPSAADCT